MKKLLGFLGWLGVALVVAAVYLRFWPPAALGVRAGDWSWYLAVAGLVVTLVYGLSQWRDIGRSVQSRDARYGSIALGSVLAFLAILVAINWISSRQNKRWDLTSEKQFDLSDQTKKILGELKKPVHIKAYYAAQGGSSLDQLRDKVGEYQYYSKQVSAEYIDAVKEPMRSKEDKIDSVPTLLIAYDGHTERATSADEQNFTNALKKAIEGKAKKVYFIQGHAEKDPTGTAGLGYSTVTDAMKTDNFEIAKLTLAQEGRVPDDATSVVIAGPKGDYLPTEIEALRVYLKKGGKLLLMIDPPDKLDSPPLTNLIAFAKEWGVDLGNNIVIDRVNAVGSAATPIAMPAQDRNPITDDYQVTAFQIARSATPIEGGANGHTAKRLVETSPQSWGETNLKDLYAGSKTPPQFDADKGDLKGPVPVASVVSAAAPDAPEPASPELPRTETRLVVAGDSDFLNNGLMGVPGNRDFGLNIMNWLAQQENLISIRPKDPENRPLTLSSSQKTLTNWMTLVIVPLLLIGNGVRLWWKSR